jgi:hypothetical protein
MADSRQDTQGKPVVLYSDSPGRHPLYGDLTGPVRPTLLVNHREPTGTIARAYIETGADPNVKPDGTAGYGERYSNTGHAADHYRYGPSSFSPPGKLRSGMPADD